nr:DUF3226 domain-containing protein [Cohaesibacter sp. ES.047]
MDGDYLVILNCGGIDCISSKLKETLAQIIPDLPNSVLVIVDSDDVVIAERFASICQILYDVLSCHLASISEDRNITLPTEVGVIGEGDVNIGIFSLPNNSDQGAIEKLILSGFERHNPLVYSEAVAFVEGIAKKNELDWSDVQSAIAGQGGDKAKCRVMFSVISPDKNMDVSLSQLAIASFCENEAPKALADFVLAALAK